MRSVLTSFVLLFFLCILHGSLQAAEVEPEQGWWRHEDTTLTAVLLTTAGLSLLADRAIRDELQRSRHGSLDTISEGFNSLGSPQATLAMGGLLYVWGRFGENAYRAETGKLALQAVLAAQVATVALKYGSGRLRPGPGAEADDFRPFEFEDGHDSLPSGHAAGAFALASILSQRTADRRYAYLYYGLASLVGMSRVYQDDHWTSDVLLGALIGELSGRLTLRAAEKRDSSLVLRPLSRGAGLELAWLW